MLSYPPPTCNRPMDRLALFLAVSAKLGAFNYSGGVWHESISALAVVAFFVIFVLSVFIDQRRWAMFCATKRLPNHPTIKDPGFIFPGLCNRSFFKLDPSAFLISVFCQMTWFPARPFSPFPLLITPTARGGGRIKRPKSHRTPPLLPLLPPLSPPSPHCDQDPAPWPRRLVDRFQQPGPHSSALERQ